MKKKRIQGPRSMIHFPIVSLHVCACVIHYTVPFSSHVGLMNATPPPTASTSLAPRYRWGHAQIECAAGNTFRPVVT